MFKRFAAVAALSLMLAACNGTRDSDNERSMDGSVLRWTWEQTGTGPDEIPQYEIKLVDDASDEKHMVVCNGVPATQEIEESDTAVRCWWAGGGNDYAVFEVDGGYSVQTRWVDEESGFGEWEELIVVQ